MANYQVLRHTFTREQIQLIKDAIHKNYTDKSTPEATRHNLASIILLLDAVHRLSISYVTTDKK